MRLIQFNLYIDKSWVIAYLADLFVIIQ